MADLYKEIGNDSDYGSINDNSSAQTEDPQTSAPSPSPMTRHQYIVFCGIALAYFADLTSFSLIAPFYPIEAKEKDLSPVMIGFVFSVFSLVQFLSSPIFGKLLPYVGAKFMFLAGSWVAAGSNLIFGVLDELEPGTQFLVFCLVTRCVGALGASASVTAATAIIAHTFPDRTGQMMGLLELFCGVGLMVGPALGGLLYSVGGYKLPFMVLGAADTLVVIINIFLIRSSEGMESKTKGSMLAVAKIPAVWVIALTCGVASTGMGFLDPTMSPHLKEQYNLSPVFISLVYILSGSAYAIATPLWGYLSDKKRITRTLIVFGLTGGGVCFLFLGPTPLFPQVPTDQVWTVIVTVGLGSLLLGCAIVPTFIDLLNTAKWYGLPDDISTQGIVSGVFNSFFSLGAFVGPTVGGVLQQHYGFPWASTMVGFMFVIMAILIVLFGFWEYQCGKGRRRPPNNDLTRQVSVNYFGSEIDDTEENRGLLS
ncbi:MFS-type transporter SLC18B1-like [Amphiura filiformis]|uniref:MFS-type transporter SLC18B1-like n=1 Tax=Amphiura filiformis TaxID=82378 RepID=UPI003B210E2A